MVAAPVLALIALAAIIATAWPLARPVREQDLIDPLTDAQRRRLALREERDLALLAIKELDLDLATGHIGEEDHAQLVAEQRARAAAAIRALDEELARGGIEPDAERG
jgi:hypothetical protein